MRKYIDRGICLTKEMIISSEKAIDYRFRYKLPSCPKIDTTYVYHAKGLVLQMLLIKKMQLFCLNVKYHNNII